MLKPPLPLNETQRLLSLHALQILDSPQEERYDRITRLAQRVFNVDICLISLVDEGRQWFKSKQGLDACETSREISFCGHAILDNEVLIVSDAAADPRFLDNPLVIGAPHIRFYAGCPIKAPGGERIGTLCLIDPAPRDLPADDESVLRDIAALVEDELKVTAQATLDELTGIANRRGFNTVAGHMLSLCERAGVSAELVYFDVNGMKIINDTYGHDAGDALLKHFAGLLLKSFRSADVVARVGGDEFVVLITAADKPARETLARLEELAAAEDRDILDQLAFSVGTAKSDPRDKVTVERLLADADADMYANKLGGRGSVGVRR